MNNGRKELLYQTGSASSTWNERMVPGEYAVHFSRFEDAASTAAPYCLVFESLAAAEENAAAKVARQSELRCRIYNHNGFAGAPLREFRGANFHDKTDISPRFRRWGGGVLFVGGLLLFCIDWAFGFRWLWPSMLGSRMIMPGAVLVVTDLFILLYERHRRRSSSLVPR